ncbi:MAG TPA: hypothetical protein VN838_24590 [Bradyrhizobium sp.]|nr:hypothetical protein [Bradyrhizobium sp.]
MTRCLRAAGFFPLLHGCPNATPGKLPKTVIPVHDAIELTPDLESLALAGVEVVDIEVREPSPFAVDTALGLDPTLGTLSGLAGGGRRAARCRTPRLAAEIRAAPRKLPRSDSR